MTEKEYLEMLKTCFDNLQSAVEAGQINENQLAFVGDALQSLKNKSDTISKGGRE